jgi:hypothetical protein
MRVGDRSDQVSEDMIGAQKMDGMRGPGAGTHTSERVVSRMIYSQRQMARSDGGKRPRSDFRHRGPGYDQNAPSVGDRSRQVEGSHKLWDLLLQSLLHHQLPNLVSHRRVRWLEGGGDISAIGDPGHLITISCHGL